MDHEDQEPPDKKMKMNEEDEEVLTELPDKCPVCHKTAKNLLLHIKKKKSCNSKIDQKLYDYWKRTQERNSVAVLYQVKGTNQKC